MKREINKAPKGRTVNHPHLSPFDTKLIMNSNRYQLAGTLATSFHPSCYVMADILLVGEDTIALCSTIALCGVHLDYFYGPNLYLPCIKLRLLTRLPTCIVE